MQRFHTEERRSRRRRGVAAAVALLALLAAGVVAPTGAAAQSRQPVLARAASTQLPAGELIFRFLDLTVPAGQPPVTHAHGAGFAYAVEGTHVLTAGGRETPLAPGQASWVGAQEDHTHGARAGAASRFWFVLVGPAATRGTPPTWPYPTARIVGESESFRMADAGARDLVLDEVRLERRGDAVGPLGRNGPVAVAVLEGQVASGGQVLQAGGTVLQQPGDGGTFTNTGPGRARLLALHALPTGTALRLPATGAGAGGTPSAAGLALASLAGLALAGAALVVRRPGRR